MSKLSRMVFVACACLGVLAAVPAGAENPSKPFEKPLAAVLELKKAKKFDEAAAKLREARSIGGATAYDTFVMNEFGGEIAAGQQKMSEAYELFASDANSPYLAGKGQRQKMLVGIAYQLKNYPAAIEHANAAEAQGADDDTTRTFKAQSFYLTNKFKEANAAAADIVARQERAGHRPDKSALTLLRDVQQRTGDNAGLGRTMEKLISFYPSPEIWTRAISSLKDQAEKAKDDRLTLQVYRLMADVGTVKTAQHYSEMAQLAVEQGFPAEAQHVLEQGLAKGVFSDQREKDRSARLLETTKKLVAAERTNIAKTESQAAAAADGNLSVTAGASYAFNLDNPAKGASLIATGISKGSLKSLNDAYVTLGVVNFRQKNNAEANKAFGKVSKNEAYERLAKLWSLHIH